MAGIRERREKLHLSQGELAELAGVFQSQVSLIEGNKKVSKATRAKVLTALSVAETSPSKDANTEASPGDSEGMGTLGKTGSVLEIALGAAFDHQRHLLRDMTAVFDAFKSGALPQLSEPELRELCGQWLDASVKLRTEKTPVTAQTISALIAVRAMRPH